MPAGLPRSSSLFPASLDLTSSIIFPLLPIRAYIITPDTALRTIAIIPDEKDSSHEFDSAVRELIMLAAPVIWDGLPCSIRNHFDRLYTQGIG